MSEMTLSKRLRGLRDRPRDEAGFVGAATMCAVLVVSALCAVAFTTAGAVNDTTRRDARNVEARQNAVTGINQALTSWDSAATAPNPWCGLDVAARTGTLGAYAVHVDPDTATMSAAGYRYAALADATTPPTTLTDGSVASDSSGGWTTGATVKTLSAPLRWKQVVSYASAPDDSTVYGVPANAAKASCDTSSEGKAFNHGIWSAPLAADASLSLAGTVGTQTPDGTVAPSFEVDAYGGTVHLGTVKTPTGDTLAPAVVSYADSVAISGGQPPVRSGLNAAFDHNLIDSRIATLDTPSCLANHRPRGILAPGSVYCGAAGLKPQTLTPPATGVATVLVNGDLDLSATNMVATGTGQVDFYVTGNVTLGGRLDHVFIYSPRGTCTAASTLQVSGAIACHSVALDQKPVTMTYVAPLPDPLSDAASLRTVYYTDTSDYQDLG